jgi:hypothetical protein
VGDAELASGGLDEDRSQQVVEPFLVAVDQRLRQRLGGAPGAVRELRF